MKLSKYTKLLAPLLLLAAAAAALLLWLCGLNFCKEDNKYLYIRTGETFDEVCSHLRQEAPTARMTAFQLADRILGYHHRIRPGRYRLSNISTLQLVRNLRNGQQEPIRLTIPTVWTPAQLAGKLSKRLEADSASLALAFTDSATLANAGIPPHELFSNIIPDTYETYWTIKPTELLKRLKREYNRYWTPERDAKATQLGLTRNQVATLASIVERETSRQDERPIIAGLYLNRLRQGMKLQADPTVKYAMQDFALKRILLQHLSTPSPYNTYLNPGLPPSPISLPSKNSMEAVLNSTSHDYLYMCAKEDFSGQHNFAATYAQHQVNARRYAAALNAKGIH